MFSFIVFDLSEGKHTWMKCMRCVIRKSFVVLGLLLYTNYLFISPAPLWLMSNIEAVSFVVKYLLHVNLKMFYFIGMQLSWLKLLKREFMMQMLRPEWRQESKSVMRLYDFFFFCLFAFSRAIPTVYGASQARGLIGAVAAGLCQSHSNIGSKPCLRPIPQLTASWIFNPLSEAKDGTHNLMVPSWIH